MAVKNLVIRGGANFSAMNKGLAQAQSYLVSFQNKVGSVMKKVGFLLGGIAAGKLIKDTTQMAMSVESSMDNINRTMQSNAQAFQKWVNTQAKGMGIAKAEAYKYGSTYSNLLSSFSKSSDETAKNTEELMKATAIISSKTGRTYEDTAERIRSGMLGSTEAIEDLGVYTNISMIESTEAFKKFAGSKSWAQLDFQTQQQIRLAAILEQTYARYGDTLADTSQTRHNQFIASLKNIQLTLGQAFLPIYNAILPPLTAFIDTLGKAISGIAQFTTALFGNPKAASQQAKGISKQASAIGDLNSGLGDAGKSASKAKKAIKSLASIDEINTLSKGADKEDPSESVGIGSIGTLDTDGFINGTVEVSESVKKMADKIKTIFGKIKNIIINNKDIIISAIAGIASAFAAFTIITKWSSIVNTFSKALIILKGAVGALNAPILAISAIIGLLVGNIVYLWRTNEKFRDSVKQVWNSIKAFMINIVTDMWTIVKDIWDQYGETLVNNIKDFMKSIQDIIVNVWESILKPLINDALELLTWLWDSHLKGLIETFGEVVMKLINGALEIWNKCLSPIINWLVEKVGPIFKEVVSFMANIFADKVARIIDIGKGIIKVFGGIIDFITGVFTGNWKKALEGVKNITKGIFDSLEGVVKFPINLIIDAANLLIRGLNKISIDVPDWVPKFGGESYGIKIPQIPKLAQGGYVEANNPMLAIIGDNKRHGEIVAPEDKLYEQTFKAVTDAVGSANLSKGDNDNGDLVLMIDGSVIGKVALKQLKKMHRQGGIALMPM